MQYLRARYYNPAVGRFLSQDPLPLPQRYPYVGNSPVNLTDPYGLNPWDDFTGCIGSPVDCAADRVDDVVECAANRGDCLPDPVSGVVEVAGDLGQATWAGIQYCNAHLWECLERVEIVGVGVATTVFGLGIAAGGCLVIAPVVGAATAVVGGIATCAGALTASTIVVAGGVTIVIIGVTSWPDHDSAQPIGPEKP